jgi:phosphatidate cytidylyltransferase
LFAGPLFAFITVLGGYYIFGLVLIIGGMSCAELSRFASKGYSFWWLQMLACMAVIASSVVGDMDLLISVVVIYVILRTFFALNQHDVKDTANAWAFDIAGLLLISLGWMFFIKLRYFGLKVHMIPDNFNSGWYFVGGRLALVVVFLIWLYDISAYLGGRAFGKHKLLERVSPGKTWEGLLVGFFVTVGGALLLGIIMLTDEFDPLSMAGLGILVVVLGQTGDLLESLLKRAADKKDSSQIIPGHGGLLDRFDSFVMVMPAAYYYLKFLAEL